MIVHASHPLFPHQRRGLVSDAVQTQVCDRDATFLRHARYSAMTQHPCSSKSMIEVLVVEDDPLLRMDAIDIVEDAGYRAHEAANADEAMELLCEHPSVRVLFTDVEMPGSMNGLELAERVHRQFPEMGIIIVSGHPKITKASLPIDVDFFAKPYPVDRFTETLDRVVSLSMKQGEGSYALS
ncbi:response regulator [Fulvimarina sp. MAC8]|uniref:response regulator n=1 Tax=Fulvimarina sp. MAC8 TaxID=3162874 RepID=UPI0032EEAE05